MAVPYGGLMTSPYPTAPATVFAAGNIYRWRPIQGFDLRQVTYRQAKASETIRRGDILCVTSEQVERALNPAGTATTATLSGNGGSIPRFVAAYNASTGSASDKSVIACWDISKLELLFRLYHATAATAVSTGLTYATDPGVTTGVYYEWGIAEIDATSTNYFPVLDLANQDDTNGSFKAVELWQESTVTDLFPGVWVQASGVA